jgi:phosphatidylglycerophosphate synthase
MTTPAANPDRRPIAARNTAVMQRIAAWLIARRASPNGISIAGMLAGIGAGVCLAATPHADPFPARLLFLAAAALIQLRLLANLFDGMVAVGRGIASPLGELYNEILDRVSDFATLVGLGYATGGSPQLGYSAASLAIFCAYIRAVGKAAGAGSDFRGPMAKQQRMFFSTITALYLALAPLAWRPAWGPSDRLGIPAAVLLFIAAGTALTCLRRLLGIATKLRAAASPQTSPK